jgi:hypothetical protein
MFPDFMPNQGIIRKLSVEKRVSRIKDYESLNKAFCRCICVLYVA